jgi:WD40 repeat protein
VTFSLDGNFVVSLFCGGKTQAWDSVTGIPYGIDIGSPGYLSLPGAHGTQLSWSKFHFYLSDAFQTNELDRLVLNSPKDEDITCRGYLSSEFDPLALHYITLWNSSEDILISGPFRREGELITAFAFSPDGTRVVSASECGLDTNIRIWEIRDGPNSYWSGEAWRIEQDGWLRDQDIRPVLWVPEQWRSSFPVAPNKLTIGNMGNLKVSMDNLLLGELWTECYTPPTPNPSG